MKRLTTMGWAVVIGGLAHSVAAQTGDLKSDFDRRMAVTQKGAAAILAAERQNIGDCTPGPKKFQYPYVSINLDDPFKEETRPGVVTVTGWSGRCAGGKREGKGVLDWSVERIPDQQTRNVSYRSAEGAFVKGDRRGLWCVRDYRLEVGGKPASEAPDVKGNCSVITGTETNLVNLPNYRKLDDGRWQLWMASGPASPPTYLPSGALESQSAKILGEAASEPTAKSTR